MRSKLACLFGLSFCLLVFPVGAQQRFMPLHIEVSPWVEVCHREAGERRDICNGIEPLESMQGLMILEMLWQVMPRYNRSLPGFMHKVSLRFRRHESVTPFRGTANGTWEAVLTYTMGNDQVYEHRARDRTPGNAFAAAYVQNIFTR